MTCERCGNEIADSTQMCPFCGTLTSRARTKQLPDGYSKHPQYPYTNFSAPPPYQQGYQPQSNYAPPPQSFAYAPPTYHPGPMQQQGPINVTVMHTTGRSSGALVVEMLFSLFGIFGIGWLVGGETAVGIVLVACSIFVYWPLIIIGTILTLGLGLLCLGPLAIGAIILNAILLNNALNRKAAHFVVLPTPPPQQPLYSPQSSQMPMPPPQQ